MVHHLPIPIDEAEQKQELLTEVSYKSNNLQSASAYTATQLSLFPEESVYLDELRKLNLNDMTPLQALNYLHEITDRLRQE